jgi:uncharacterized protein YndB with AHSA1/START domain
LPSRVSSKAVKAATGKSWDEWLDNLRQAETTPTHHRELVAHLGEVFHLSPWWRQQVALAYEEAEGQRTVGLSAGAGYEIGARRTLPITLEEAWARLTSIQGVAAWLGAVHPFLSVEGGRYRAAGAAAGEFRVVKPAQLLRLTWLPPGWSKPSTIQVRLLPAGPGKTVISFHQENLPDEAARRERRQHWQAALAFLAGMPISATPATTTD